MSTRIPNPAQGSSPPDPPARPDGQPYPYELITPAWRGYADDFAGLASLLLDGYGEPGTEEERQEARLRYAADVQVPIQADLAAGKELQECSEQEKDVLLAPRDTPPAVREWRAPVPLVLVTTFYQPHGDLPRPDVSGPGQIMWIDPGSDESLLVSLHQAGWITVNKRTER